MCTCTACVVYMCVATIGKTESYQDKMRSILAQFEFTKTIREFELKGYHLVLPEQHPDTGDLFYEREDDAHILKVN